MYPVPLPVALPGQTRVWAASVAENAAAATARRRELDRTESLRADRFRRFADVCLRDVLGTVLGTPPARLVIDREPCAACGGPHGRPYLPGRPVHFSLAHGTHQPYVGTAAEPAHTAEHRVYDLPVPTGGAAALALWTG
ncbi:hypothetical protein ACFCYC_03115 [Streptomyces sp. NPDC056402]|uniref:hypothetical protein n=1 Tax=Streptomyces sp. NPDC056402 TaxID=3345810 RepID=UPI0035DBE3DE